MQCRLWLLAKCSMLLILCVISYLLGRASLFARANFHNFKSEEYLLGKVIAQKKRCAKF